MGKVLYIRDCYFRLPEDFTGTCGNALMLLALHRLEREEHQSISNEANNKDRLDDFWESNNRCTMAYCIDAEEKIKDISEKKDE